MNRPDFWMYRRRLPHWRLTEATYFVTWRLHAGQPDLAPAERELVVSALRHFNGDRYELLAHVVMNDQVHALVTPLGQRRLEDIVQAWKSYTAHILKKREQRSGSLWQAEYFDRIVCDDAELIEKAQYILNNPWKRWPELEEYPWVGAEGCE